MKKIVLLALVSVLFSAAIVWGFIGPIVGHTNRSSSSSGEGKFVFVSSKTIWVPDNFTSIQEAINNASDGDTIFVCNGTYYENVFVSKAITLIGESKEGTIIDGGGVRTTVEVHVNNVTITGFTIENSNIPLCSGIEIYNSNYVNIIDNIITNNNGYGVEIYGSSYFNTVSDNIITNNQVVGILIYDPDGKAGWNVVKANCIINNTGSGIVLTESHTNTLEDNVITNQGTGIFFTHAANNTIKNNLISNNQKGIYLWGYHTLGNSFFHNNFINNTYQAYGEYISSNSWDDGYPSGGNYWSDYTSIDANGDGIGDKPYIIDANNTDRYPLMHPWSSLPVHNINTGLGYAAIQEAIDANETLDGHVIFVETGIYYEHVVVDKTVSLVGQNNTTIIDGNRTGTVIVITANNVTLSGFTILNSGDYPNSGIFLDSTSNCEIKGNAIINNYHGIRLLYSTKSTITQNVVKNSDVDGIVLSSSHNNRIEDNEVTSSGNMGVELNLDSHFNTIISNNITGNRNGIGIFDSDGNMIYGNIIERNGAGIWFQHSNTNSIEENLIKQNYFVGVWLISSDSNHIYHNDFFENPAQANIGASYGNSLDNGYPSGGNYWSNYNGTDLYNGPYQNETGSDGIGDTAFSIDANNTDSYPLMGMFSDFNVTSDNNVQTICDSSIFNFQFDGTAISFDVSGENGTAGFCRICIPTALMNGTFKVFVNGTEVPYILLSCSNSTYSYLYFTYNHSTQEVIIIPEFPTLTSTLLTLTTITAAIVIYKRRLFCCS
jgi:parallel beta-helix repeat protein